MYEQYAISDAGAEWIIATVRIISVRIMEWSTDRLMFLVLLPMLEQPVAFPPISNANLTGTAVIEAISTCFTQQNINDMCIEILPVLGRLLFWMGILLCITAIVVFLMFFVGVTVGDAGGFGLKPAYRVFIPLKSRCFLAALMVISGGSLVLSGLYVRVISVRLGAAVERVKEIDSSK